MGRNYVGQARGPQLLKLAEAHAIRPVVGEHQSYYAYCHGGGDASLKSLRGGSKTPDQAIQILLAAGPPGSWCGLPLGPEMEVRAGLGRGPRYLCINGDEGEPWDLQGPPLSADPARISSSKACWIAAWGVEAEKASYIYMRDEYPAAHLYPGRARSARIVALTGLGRLPATSI